MKTGLVLEGGAMRGVFSAGVMDVMMENGIIFDMMVGVSAGAAFGSNYKSAQIGRAIRYNKKYSKDKRYCSLRSLIFTGDMYGAEFCYHTLPNELDVFDKDAFEKNPMEFYVVCTDINTGKPFYKKIDKAGDTAYEWIRASSSLPLVSRIVKMEGKEYLDGGITDSIPLKFSEEMGCYKNIVILTQPKGYIKKKTSMMWLMKLALRKYPKMIEALEARHIMYNDTLKYIEEKEREGSALVICPDQALVIKRVEHDENKLEAVYQLGRKTAEKRLEEIKEFLSK